MRVRENELSKINIAREGRGIRRGGLDHAERRFLCPARCSIAPMASALSLLPIEHVWVPQLDTDDNEMLSQMEEELKDQVQQHSQLTAPPPPPAPAPHAAD